LAVVVGAPGRISVQKVQGVEALLMARTGETEVAQWWLPTVSSAAARAWEQSSVKEEGRGEETLHYACAIR
jgi:hypothetical protein